MINPKTKDVESKVKVTLFTGRIDFEKLRSDIYEWAAHQGISIFWISCFLNSQHNEQGARVYFEDVIDAMAFKLAWL